jgi:uncharacterized membrane protein YkvI
MHSVVRLLRIYLVPGAVFEALIVAGGYGTGREIVQYFTRFGIGGGLLGMLVATICMAAVLCMTFEIARAFRVYEYHGLISRLIGRASLVFELLLVTSLLVTLAIIGAAAGNILAATFGAPVWLGVVIMLGIVAVLSFYGREIVIRVLSFWALLLLAVFVAYFILVLSHHPELLHSVRLHISDIQSGWFQGGLQYAMYNIAAGPVMLYATRDIETRAQAVISGILAALFAMSIALLFHVTFAAAYPEILAESLPVYSVIHTLGIPVLMTIYIIVLCGTIIKTSAGILQGVNERYDEWYLRKRGRSPSRLNHAVFAAVAIGLSASLSSFGLVTLIARGYGTLAWGFLLMYVVPLFTVGSSLLIRQAASGMRMESRA